MRRRLARAALLLGILLSPGALWSQSAPSVPPTADTALDRKVREVASILRCPVCLNLSIQDSPSELARDMRDLVRERVAKGETRDQILQYFVQRYGEWVLMEPPAHGVNLLVWVTPAVAVLGGGALIVLSVLRWTRNTAAREQPGADVAEEDLRKVREEMAKGPSD